MSETEQNTEPTELVEPVEPTDPAPEPAPAPTKNGYKTREEWAEAGKNPDDYVSQEVFEAKGSLLKQIRKLERKFDAQASNHEASLANQNKLHGIALTNRIKVLEAERDEAIDDADRKTANARQTEIDDNKAVVDSLKEPEQAATAPEKAPEQAAWEEENAWIFDDNDPKAAYAKTQFSKIANSGTVNDYNELFAKLDAQMAKAFPETPVSKRAHRAAEGGSGHSAPKVAALNVKDFSSEEGKYFMEYGAQVVPGKDDVKMPNGKTIRGVDKAKMMEMIKESRAD